MPDPSPPRQPRWWVGPAAVLGFAVGAVVMLNESLFAGTDRPTLLAFAYLLMAGGPIGWALDKFRK